MEHGAQIVVLDALHDYFAGNESVRVQVRQFVSLLRSLAIDIDGAVVLCAHPSLSGLLSGSGTSGSTAWNNAVRSRLYLTHPPVEDEIEPDPDKRVLKVMKANYSRTGEGYPLRYERGVFVRQEQPDGMLGTITRRSVEHAFLDGLRALLGKGHEPSFKIEARSLYAPKLMRGWPQVEGFGVKDLAQAMDRLMGSGDIVLAESTEGPPSRHRTIIVPKDHPSAKTEGSDTTIETPTHTPTDTPHNLRTPPLSD